MCNTSQFRHHLHLQKAWMRYTRQKPGSLITAAQSAAAQSGQFLPRSQQPLHDNTTDDASMQLHLWLQQRHFRTELHTWLSLTDHLACLKNVICSCRAEAFWPFLILRLHSPTVHADVCMRPWWKPSMCLFVIGVVFCAYFACLWWVCIFMQGISVFTRALSRRWRSCWLLWQPLLSCNKAWFKVDQSTPGRVPCRSFPLQPVEMRSLHNIYPGNNDIWFDCLLGVSLQGLFSSSAATERENRQKCPQEKKPQIIVYGWC